MHVEITVRDTPKKNVCVVSLRKRSSSF